MNLLRVAVLRGGPSDEHQVSMRTGKVVLSALNDLGYYTKDIIISKNGDWLENGIVRKPEAALSDIDVVFIALHGSYGEDGEVQKILQRLKIPFTGSQALPSAMAFNKEFTKRALLDTGIKMAKHRTVSYDEINEVVSIAESIKSDFGPSYIIKPVASGSSFGVELIEGNTDLAAALDKALRQHEKVLVEEYIRGREATVATLENFRDSNIYTFPTIEIVTPRTAQFFDTESKYNDTTQEICPSTFKYSDRKEVEEIAALVHKTLGLSQYSRSDFIITDDGIYFLEVNTLPGLTSGSLYPKAAAAVGLELNDLVKHLIQNATC